MSTAQPWIDDVLRKLQFQQNVLDSSSFDNYRLMVDRSRLVERMRATGNAVNSEAGEGLIFEDFFIQPQPLTCRYVFERDGIESSMSLAILSEGPTLIFSSTKASLWGESIRRCLGQHLQRKRDNVEFQLLINPTNVDNADLQQWFTYLLSGLQHSFKPTKKNRLAQECN